MCGKGTRQESRGKPHPVAVLPGYLVVNEFDTPKKRAFFGFEKHFPSWCYQDILLKIKLMRPKWARFRALAGTIQLDRQYSWFIRDLCLQ